MCVWVDDEAESNENYGMRIRNVARLWISADQKVVNR